MAYSRSCSVCQKSVETSSTASDTICGKEQLKVCSQICGQYLQYSFGFVHGFIICQVLSRLCKNLFSSNRVKLYTAPTSSFMVAENDCNRENITGDAFSNTTVKREPWDMGRSDDDVTDLKVFFLKNTQNERRKVKCTENEHTVTNLQGWSATLDENVERDHSDEEELVTDLSEEAQHFSEGEGYEVNTSVEKNSLKCCYCPVAFPPGTDQEAVTQHLCQVHTKGTDQNYGIGCAVLKERGFATRYKRNIHLKCPSETGNGKYECNGCGRKFSGKDYLQDHLQRSNCGTCRQSSENKALLNKASKHEQNDSEKNVFQCGTCNKTYPSRKALQCHFQFTHLKPVASKCSACGLSFRKKILLKQHKMSKHCKGKDGENETFRCDQCNKECPSRKSLQHHIRFMHSTHTPVDCKVCGQTYRNVRLAREHMRTVHRVRLISSSSSAQEAFLRCTFCPETFPAGAKEHVANHLKEHHGKEMAPALSCDICGDKFKRKFTLDYHKRNTHSLSLMDTEAKSKIQKEKMHPCDKCGKTLSKNSMRRHILMFHSKHIPVDCKMCGKKLRSALHLERHMRCHRNLPSRVCHICGANLKTDQGLKSHLAAHKGIKSHICEICGAGFVRRTSWQRHVRQHSDTVFQCDICAKAFTTDYALHTHMLSRHQRGMYFNNRLRTVEELGYTVDREAISRHLNHQCVTCGENLVAGKCPAHPTDFMLKFECNKCGLRAKHIEFFCHHLKNHDDPIKSAASTSRSTRNYTVTSATSKRGEAVMAYTCKVCHKSFQRREYVSHHMRQHKEKTFACPACDKKFTYKCNMKNHLLTHSEDKPFKCGVCQKGFKRQALLKCHAHVHDPNRSPFKCHICGKGLTRKQYLQQHYRLVHPETQGIPTT